MSALPERLSPKAKKLFREPAFLVGYLNFDRILDVIRNLDATALGSGGMMMKMALDMAVSVVKNLEELTIIIQSTKGGVLFRGHLKIQ